MCACVVQNRPLHVNLHHYARPYPCINPVIKRPIEIQRRIRQIFQVYLSQHIVLDKFIPLFGRIPIQNPLEILLQTNPHPVANHMRRTFQRAAHISGSLYIRPFTRWQITNVMHP